MVRHGSVLLVVSLLGATSLSQPSRAGDLAFPFNGIYHAALAIFDPPPSTYGAGYQKSPYVDWRARRDLGLATAPLAIANEPCYVYRGARLVVAPCGGFAAPRYAAVEAPEVIAAPIPADYGERRDCCHPGGPYVIRRSY